MTPAAEHHVLTHLQHRAKGLSYVLEFVDDTQEEDIVTQCGEVKLVVDPKSLIYLDGTELDYVREGLNEGFEFKNPNVSDECGCGESFHV